MSSIIDIIRNNRSTFYNYNTKEAQRVFPRLVSFVALAAIAALSMRHVGEDFLGAVLTVQSILVGFSFSVLFFLLTGDRINSDNKMIEENLRSEKVNKISKEIFYNVSYFNLTAISSVALSLFMLLPSLSLPRFMIDFISQVEIAKSIMDWSAWKYIFGVVWVLSVWALFTILIESLYTFARTVGRVTYLFGERLRMEESED